MSLAIEVAGVTEKESAETASFRQITESIRGGETMLDAEAAAVAAVVVISKVSWYLNWVPASSVYALTVNVWVPGVEPWVTQPLIVRVPAAGV